MVEIFSKVKKEKVLHILFTPNIKTKTINITNPKELLQLSFFNFKKDRVIERHKHLYKKKIPKVIKIQESWVIISGLAMVIYYDLDNKILLKKTLKPGDVSITLDGSHKLKILKDNTRIYEFKNGPYEGSVNDLKYL
tara:strand:- start:555 stop:965 length:411 start_codon:yes stop_codon:yes gene_type:complete